MRVKTMRRFMFLTMYLLFSQFLISAGAEQDADGIVSSLRGNAKLTAPDKILADFVKGEPETAVIVRLRPSEEAKALEALSRSSAKVPPDFTGPGAPPYYNLKNDSIRSQLRSAVAATVGRALGRLEPQGVTVKRKFSYVFGFAANVTPAALARIAAMPEVISVEKDHILQPHLAQGIPLMNGTAPRSSYTGSGLSIAICDSGVDTSHPALGGGGFPNAKVIGGYDTGDDDADPRPDSLAGSAHGTACAGIAAGSGVMVGDYIGGVAPDAKLYAIKISRGTGGAAYDSSMIAGWEWAVTHKNDDPDNPIMIISTSYGGDSHPSTCDSESPAMTAAAANAVAAGITIFASSGNDGYCASMGWPACISYVNSVGAVYDGLLGNMGWCLSVNSCAPKSDTPCDSGYVAFENAEPDRVAVYSNSASFLTVLAPSNNAYAPDIAGAGGYSPGDYAETFGGTSAACPYAAGAAAVLQHAAKAKTGSWLTPAEVRAYLSDNGDNITDTKVAITKPRVNLARAVDALTAEPDFAITLSPVSITVAPGGMGSATVTTTVSHGFNNAVALSVTGLPAGVTAAFNPASIPGPGSGSSSLTLAVSPGAPLGSHTVTVTGAGGGVTHTATFTLVIRTTITLFSDGFEGSGWLSEGEVDWDIISQGITPLVSPHGGAKMAAFRSFSAMSGQGRLYRGSGFSIPGSAATARLSFWMYHDTEYLDGDNVQVQVSTDGATWSNVGAPIQRYDGSNSWKEATLDLSSYRGAANLRLGFLGTSRYGSDIYLDDVAVVTEGVLNPEFTIAASPLSGTVSQGGAVETTVTTTVSGGFNADISLSVTGLPTGATATFTPPAIAAPGAGSSTLRLTTTKAVPAGAYTLTVTGSGGGITHSAAFTLTVVGVLPPSTITVPATSATGNYTVSWSASLTPGVTYTLEESTTAGFDPLATVVVTSGATATSAAISGKTTGTYYYRVKAVSASVGDSAWTTGANGVLLPPPVPTLVGPSGVVTTLTPVYTWVEANGATAYDLYVNRSGAATTISYSAATVCSGGTCSVTSAALPNGASVYWIVRSKNAAGVSAWSSSRTFVVTTATIPAAPVAVAPSGIVQTSTPVYTWNTTNGATSYDLYRAINGNRTTTTYDAAAVCSGGTCSVTSPVLADGTAGYWVVRGKNLAGAGNWSTGKTFTVSLAALPATPVTVSPSGVSTTVTPTYTWNSVAGATSYDLYTNVNGVPSTVNHLSANVCSAGACSVASPALAEGDSVYWIVRAKNNAGTSPWSTSKRFTVFTGSIPVAPVTLAPSGTVATLTPSFTWNPVAGATSYEIYRKVGTVATYTTHSASVCSSGTCTVASSPLTAGDSVYWIVRAKNLAGTSPWSTSKTFVVAGP